MLSKHFLAAAMGAGLVSASWSTGYAQQAPAVQAATTLPFVSPIFGDNMGVEMPAGFFASMSLRQVKIRNSLAGREF